MIDIKELIIRKIGTNGKEIFKRNSPEIEDVKEIVEIDYSGIKIEKIKSKGNIVISISGVKNIIFDFNITI